ncbi:MAG: hypothetical protein WCL16_10210 [bacterium]
MKTKMKYRALIVLPIICIAALLLALWKQQANLSQIKQDYLLLQKQREQLQLDLTSARADVSRRQLAPSQAHTQAAQDTQDHSLDDSTLQLSALQPTKLQPETPPPVSEPNRLTLAGVEARPVAGGIEAGLKFTPRTNGPLGHVALVVRMPRNVEAIIIDLKPAGAATFSDSNKTISENGKFACFQGTLGEETNIQFTLSVSAPVTADVRGTHGIGAFQLEVQPTGAKVSGR